MVLLRNTVLLPADPAAPSSDHQNPAAPCLREGRKQNGWREIKENIVNRKRKREITKGKGR